MEYVFMWGAEPQYTMYTPKTETLQHFIDRKGGYNVKDKDSALTYLINYKNTLAAKLQFFIGTDQEFRAFKRNLPYVTEGKEGKFALNVEFVNSILQLMFGLAIHHKLFDNNQHENTTHVDTLEAQYLIEASKMNRGALDNFSPFTRMMLVTLFTMLETRNTENMETMLEDLYTELKEILTEFRAIDQTADLPKELVSILEEVHRVLHPTIDPNIVNGKDTLAHEMSGTK